MNLEILRKTIETRGSKRLLHNAAQELVQSGYFDQENYKTLIKELNSQNTHTPIQSWANTTWENCYSAFAVTRKFGFRDRIISLDEKLGVPTFAFEAPQNDALVMRLVGWATLSTIGNPFEPDVEEFSLEIAQQDKTQGFDEESGPYRHVATIVHPTHSPTGNYCIVTPRTRRQVDLTVANTAAKFEADTGIISRYISEQTNDLFQTTFLDD